MTEIKFAHLADLHLGGWREKTLTQLNFETFKLAIGKVIEEKVEFCLFAGDIFNNAMPPINLVEQVVVELMKLKKANIPLYVIGGSHDYSNTGKSFISLLESANVFIDVSKPILIDKNKIKLKFFKEKNNICISGILGKKNGLDKNIYANLNETNLNKNNFNIFMFHTTLDDIKPDFLKAVKSQVNSSYLPKGFDYYAGGHVHTFIKKDLKNGATLSYPGPLFPNNFTELKREKCSFNLCEIDTQTKNMDIKRIFLNTFEKEYLKIEINNLNPIKTAEKIEENLNKINYKNKILLLEIAGIVDGKISDIGLNRILKKIYENQVLVILKNTYKLTSSLLKETLNQENLEIKDIENQIIELELEGRKNQIEEKIILNNILKLDLEKIDGEKVSQFEERVKIAIEKSLE